MSKQDVAEGILRAIYKRLIYVAATLGFIFIILFLIGIAAEQQRIEVQQQADRLADVERILKSLEAESKRSSDEHREQTQDDRRQNQALCLIMIQIAPEALKEIEPPLDEQCRNLTRVSEPSDTGHARTNDSPAVTMPPSIAQPQSSPVERDTQQPTDKREAPVQEETRRSIVRPILDGVTNVIEGITDF